MNKLPKIRGRGKKLRVIARAMQGWTAKRISEVVGCSESYASFVVTEWRHGGCE